MGGSSRAALRSRCFVNGAPVTLRALRALGGLLVDLNGQHSSLALREGATQLALLDKVAGCGALVAQVRTGHTHAGAYGGATDSPGTV